MKYSLPMLNKLLRRFYRGTLFQVAAITLAVIFLCSFAVFYFEHTDKQANIHSLWDGIWWAIVTIGTVGYGDKYPVSVAGRIVGLLLIFLGVGLMSLLTATIASFFVEKKIKEGKGLETVRVKDHIVICGWNQHTPGVLQGLTHSGFVEDVAVVLINELSVDEVDALRGKYSRYDLKFLRGDYSHEEVLSRANITKAKFVLIMADMSGSHENERSDERTALAALTIKSLAPHVKIIAELLDEVNKPHLRRANVDEIIVRGEHMGSLLASAIITPGVPRIFSSMMSTGQKDKLWTVEIPKSYLGKTFQELSTYYRTRQAITLGVIREKQDMNLEDLLSDNSSAIDNFIREKLKEAKKSFYIDKNDSNLVMNPDDSYIILPEDHAIVLAKTKP
jgi:voltage-gated potassium channel